MTETPDQPVVVVAPPRPPARLRVPVFLLVLIAVAGPWSRTDVALLAGIVLALAGWTAFEKEAKVVSRWLVQVCVVLLGLRLDLGELLHAATDGLAMAVGTIVGALGIGLLLGMWLRTGREVSTLISSGTAICGGSAIAAVGSAIGAASSSMAVATAAIFVLNAVGLWVLPPVGHALGLTQEQFGMWAGVALHDIASVGGAAKSFGPQALDTANVVKLTRVIWIAPIAFMAGRIFARRGGATGTFPWFILAFIAASGLRTAFPSIGNYAEDIKFVSGIGFQTALFLIGAGLSRAALRQVGWRAIVQATVLWVIVAGGSLAAIRLLSA